MEVPQHSPKIETKTVMDLAKDLTTHFLTVSESPTTTSERLGLVMATVGQALTMCTSCNQELEHC
jgi:hypothetical protein